MMPPTIPRSIPAMKPPPIMRLKIAKGKTMMSASAPLRRTMIIEPMIRTRPMITPNANPYSGPIKGSQKNIPDQTPKKLGAGRPR